MGHNSSPYDRQVEHDHLTLKELTSRVARWESIVDRPQITPLASCDSWLLETMEGHVQARAREYLGYLKLQVAERIGKART